MGKSNNNPFAEIFDELRVVREKYGLPKGIIPVPDRLQITLKRNSYDNFHLSYREYFEYLPDEILDFVIPTTINSLVQMGMPKDRIVWNPHNCVGVELDGDWFLMMGVILREVAIQKRFSDEELDQISNATKREMKSLSEFSSLEFDWNEEKSRNFINNSMQMMTAIQRNPSVVFEMENVMQKYYTLIEKVNASLK